MAGRWKKFDDIYKGSMKFVEPAIIKGGNDTLTQAVAHAKANHPGWSNVTGAAERSIQVTQQMQKSGQTYKGKFGSKGVRYFIWLEIGTAFREGDRTIRRAADAVFPRVWDNVRKYL